MRTFIGFILMKIAADNVADTTCDMDERPFLSYEVDPTMRLPFLIGGRSLITYLR